MVIIGLIIASSLTGCTSASTSSAKSLSIQALNQAISQAVDLSTLKAGDAAKLKKLYDISSEDLDGFILYTAPSNLKADELLLMKAKTSTDLTSIKTKIAKRVDKQSTAFKDYLPEEHFLIQKHIIRVNGGYVLFVISKNAVKIADAFDQALK